MIIAAKPNLHNLFEKPYLREIGIEDILSFQLSSAKPGNGVEQLCDPSLETYWQSDGVSQPHWIQIQLPRRLPVTHVALYLDYQLDESYTPRTVQIETGLTVVQDTMSALSNHSTALSDAPIMELHEPVGWCIFPIHIPPDPFDTNISDHNNGSGGVVINETTMIPRSHWVRVSVLSMHQNGRDTHIRRVALFCQRTTMTMRMPQPPPPPPVHPPIVSTKESVVHANEDNTQNDHEEILLYARTRSTFPNYDPMMMIQPLGNIRVNQQQQQQQSSLFGTIR
jgi:anaphase-promoting complex subunit 10